TYEVNGTTAIITITDNVRILKAFVDGVEVDMFFPMPTATHVVTGLKIGDNNIQVLASDTKNNILDTTLVITIEPLAEPVEFTIGEETTYGTPVLMSDITMVPVRFAQDLGATVEWDNDTQTVTYTLGEIKVAMTIGSTTAIVNDSNVQLAVAPYKNELGRTMVPLRMIAQELGFTVEWTSNDAPIMIK
ncbi:MAG: copper amine oxidase N-terminal domain-containing protein, partial [Halanaerobiales bacterium]|nr:copper amine oxidase N-terminal domain-containing protein [Halanaerobiales bacterium]